MFDKNWEMINGDPAHHIEQLNAANTINVIESLATWLITAAANNGGGTWMPNEMALQELHRSATLFLLWKPGAYRTVDVHVANADGEVAHQPPPYQEVQQLMTEFFREIGALWTTGDALDVAAFALWRINWVHPFRNGNGRAARAYAYACLCSHLGVILPGAPTIIDQIMMTRPEYEAALRVGDLAAKNNNGRDLSAMRAYLDGLLQIQMASVP